MDQPSGPVSALPDAAHLLSASEGAELALAPDLTVVACSEGYGAIQGVSCEALIGRSFREAFASGPALDRLIASLERSAGLAGRIVCRPALASAVARPAPSAAIVNMPVLDAAGEVKWILHSLELAADAAPMRAASTHLWRWRWMRPRQGCGRSCRPCRTP